MPPPPALDPSADATFSLERRLSPDQARRRDAARDAARALASEGGYAAVTMQAVAERAGLSRATLYRYFSSKDHLLGEVIAEWGRGLTEALTREPPPGGPAARVAGAFARVLDAARREPRLTGAAITSVTSPDPEAIRAQARFASLIRSYLVAVLGEGAAAAPHLELVMGHVFFSALVNMTAGRISPADATRSVEVAAALFFPAPPPPLPDGDRR